MKTFGCLCYVRIPKEKRSKLDLKFVLAIFIGYSDLSKGYKFYDVKSEKIFISKGVRFNEGQSWNWNSETV